MEHNVVVVVDEKPSPSLWATSSSSSIYLAMNAKRGKAKRTFTRLNVLGSALFAHIFLPFEEEKRKATNGKSTNTWIDGWLDGRIVVITPKNSPFKRKNKPRRLHSYKCSPKLHFVRLVLRPELLQQLWNRPTNRPTHHPANSLSVLFISVYWSAFFTKSEQSKCMLIKSLW